MPSMNRKSFWLLAAGVSVLASAALAGSICVEAESAATNAPMLRVAKDVVPPGVKYVEGASDAAYLEVPLGTGKPPRVKAGAASLDLELPEEGAYTLWLRVYWEGECSNSVHVQVDDRPPFLVGEDATYHSWHWVKYPVSRMASRLALAKGSHRLSFVHREDGIRIDQVLLSSDARLVPVGIEKTGARP